LATHLLYLRAFRVEGPGPDRERRKTGMSFLRCYDGHRKDEEEL